MIISLFFFFFVFFIFLPTQYGIYTYIFKQKSKTFARNKAAEQNCIKALCLDRYILKACKLTDKSYTKSSFGFAKPAN